ncbi:putative RNA polymerase II subunit B1 CTD phosphatase RPAP2 [Periplaneta americana]|uniref:putative RNA polymerase II subunit B1 CTD phosphatase RPAP2 n=1 Tax=Periplaneta americana TaxID=6978 RepID=UPI0037E981CC
MNSVESRKVKIPKNRKSNHRLPKRVSEMSKEVLEATLIKKRECNARAFQIVERLLENNVTEEWFLDCLKFIGESHYQDVIEERAISKSCGYPLCLQKLKNIPTQQYRISTKVNKVYDITERKNFCSNQCYKASTYLKAQLLTSPLWLRDKEEIPQFKTLPVELKSGGVGEEVDFGQASLLKEELKQLHKDDKSTKFTSISQFTRDSLSKLADDIERDEKERKEKERKPRTEHKDDEKAEVMYNLRADIECNKTDVKQSQASNESEDNTLSTPTQSKESHVVSNDQNDGEYSKESSSYNLDTTLSEISSNINIGSSECSDNSKTVPTVARDNSTDTDFTPKDAETSYSEVNGTCANNTRESQKESNPKKSRESKKHHSKKKSLDIPPMTSAVIHIEKCLYEWFTIESMCFLFGEEKMKEMVSEKGECIKEYYKAVHNASWDPQTQEQYMAICRRLNIMELEDRDFDSSQRPKNPLPDYTAVKEEARKMDLKVRSFYQGRTEFEQLILNRNSDSNADSAPVLPLVELHAQNAFRRRIMLDRLNRVLPDLLRTFGLTSRDVSGDVRSLVITFALGANNITFRPPEWSLLGLIIIKMLSIRDTRLRILLDSEQVTKYITMMLISFQQDGGYLDRLMAWLTDIDNFLRKK